MKGTYLVALIMGAMVLSVGCKTADRIEAVPPRVVPPPEQAMPPEDVPPQSEREDPFQVKSVKPPFRPAVPDEDKSALIYQARLDLLRLLICSDEKMHLAAGVVEADQCLQVAKEHFSDMGFRVLDGLPCPRYVSNPGQLGSMAADSDVDMFVLFQAEAQQVDKFGDFYSFEADGRGKVAQISSGELLTTKSTLIRGKRALNEQQAAASALKQCGTELAQKLSDEILRKSGRGVLVRRVVVDGLESSEQADYIRVGLGKKAGIRSVALKSWRNGRAVFWVRLDAGAKENLAAYLEELDHVKLTVQRLDKGTIKSN